LAPVPTPVSPPAAKPSPGPAPKKEGSGPNRRLIPFGGGGSADTTEPFYVAGRIPLPKRIIHAKLRKEETRYDIKNVSRPEDSREEEIVGRPKSKYKLSKQAEIIRKIIEDKKIIIKKEKEEKLGKNPMVNTEPELKHNQLDQGS
jgi:hypothetical protein